MKHTETSAMMAPTSSSDTDAKIKTYLRVRKMAIIGVTWQIKTFQLAYTHWVIIQDFIFAKGF